MHFRFLTAPAFAALALSVFCAKPAAADSFLPVPPASFLNFHVSNVPQLTHEVIRDPVVRARLASHFHWSGAQTVTFTQNDLVLTRLASARRVRMYCISERGREYSFWTRLPAGTQVFALRSTGQPILKLACGNPLLSMLPPPARTLTPPRMLKTRAKAGRIPLPSQGIVTMTALPETSLTEAVPFAIPVVVQISAAPGQLRASHVPAAAFAPLAFFGLSHTHSSTSSSAVIPLPTGSPAPEPSAPLAVSVFFLVVSGLIMRRRLSKTENALLP